MDLYLRIDKEVKLRYRKDMVNNHKAIVLINHGFAEHLGRYEHVKNYFNSSGFSIYRYDLRGHGKTTGKKGYIESYEMFISDCNEMVDLIIKENPTSDIYMLGHSMGGLITCMYGITYPDKLKGQIFSGPAVNFLPQVNGFNKVLLNILGTLTPKIYMRNVVEDDICSVDSVVVKYKNDPQVLKKATFKFLKEFLIKGPIFINENIDDYKYPCLICHGEKDKIVPLEVGKYLYDNISSEDKKMLVYKNLYHEILNENNKFDILEDMVNWIDKRIIVEDDSDKK